MSDLFMKFPNCLCDEEICFKTSQLAFYYATSNFVLNEIIHLHLTNPVNTSEDHEDSVFLTVKS